MKPSRLKRKEQTKARQVKSLKRVKQWEPVSVLSKNIFCKEWREKSKDQKSEAHKTIHVYKNVMERLKKGK